MLELFDPQALRLHADAHREQLAATMRDGRRPRLRHRIGTWFVSMGEWLAHDDPRLRPATDTR
jgi:hypothetical protein